MSEHNAEFREFACRHDVQRRQRKRHAAAGVDDDGKVVLERRPEKKIAACRHRVQRMELRLELQGREAVDLDAAAEFISELGFGDERVKAADPVNRSG